MSKKQPYFNQNGKELKETTFVTQDRGLAFTTAEENSTYMFDAYILENGVYKFYGYAVAN